MIINLDYKNLFGYLVNTDICNKSDLEYLKIDVSSSHNFNWVIDLTTNGEKIFIKQRPHYSKLYSDDRIRKEWHIYNFFKSDQDLVYASSLTPAVIHYDDINSILIYKCPNDYITLESYYKNHQYFPNTIAKLVGTTLAKLHSETMNSQECHTFITELDEDNLRYQLPYPDYLSEYLFRCLEPESLKKTAVQSWRFIGIFQKSEAVKRVVKELALHHRHCCLTHNNIQFNKLIIPKQWEKLLSKINYSNRSIIKLIDWEACSWGDPACDLGKAIAEYFLFWLNSMIVHPAIEMKKSIQLAAIPLEVVRPSIVAIKNAYINTYPKILEDYPEFLKRVIQFAGLGLIYQLLTEFQLQPDLGISHQQLYFYIASQLLCKPEIFMSI
ncbi:hypothetical protein [Moorena sp. SIO3H5]|uniref:hypothetical protein n=1 Tax=Moorena sp. SIO3H5 TaxID=2607834 RepID=UPI0013B5ED8F|nr:hypothetical protein [Moorena sp. SIO3H5]NEO68991.1 hypothetical protein [Moorena sp. SIO3H5]